MGTDNRDAVVEHPTFLEHIRYFFDAVDIEHMKRVADLDLATYEGIRGKATQIYFQTSSGSMPPEAARRWPEGRVATFKNWIVDKFPVGSSPVNRDVLLGAAPGLTAVRRNVANLGEAELAQLRLAFNTLIQRDPTDPQSFFSLAGIHWFPSVPVTCAHHEPRYNPWHRVYIDRFEAALRSVPGCENINLPYWDILAPIPAFFFEAPFDSYTLQADAAPQYPAGFKTERNSATLIDEGLKSFAVAEDIAEAMNSPDFSRFTRFIETAHDGGHVAIGKAMGKPDIAAFDPIFWFFHCNWERLFWAWQKRYNAESLESFRSTLSGMDSSWLDVSPFNELEPFGKNTLETIDATSYQYEESPVSLFRDFAEVKTGNIPIDRSFRLLSTQLLSVRVKGIERLRIPGTFVVHLMADEKSIARRAFFQAEEPAKCPTCVRHAKVDVDLIVDRSEMENKRLEVRLETLDPMRVDPWVPLSQVGFPTINVRELLLAE
jgi:hypothetical protein